MIDDVARDLTSTNYGNTITRDCLPRYLACILYSWRSIERADTHRQIALRRSFLPEFRIPAVIILNCQILFSLIKSIFDKIC